MSSNQLPSPRLTVSEHLSDRFRPWFIFWLALMWILLMGELTWANAFAGAGLGFLITMLLPLPKLPTGGVDVNVPKLIVFLIRWVGELFVAAVQVSWLAIRPADPPARSCRSRHPCLWAFLFSKIAIIERSSLSTSASAFSTSFCLPAERT